MGRGGIPGEYPHIPLNESLLFTPSKLKQMSQTRRKIQSSERSRHEFGVNSVKGLTKVESAEDTTMLSILRLEPVNRSFGAFRAFSITHPGVKVGEVHSDICLLCTHALALARHHTVMTVSGT